MPIMFQHLPREELGLWLLLGQSWAALGIFDLGFGVTLTRRIAFAKGKSGADFNVALTEETRQDIADLVATGRRVYRALAIFAFVFSFGAGFFYLRELDLNTVSLSHVWLAWGVLCLSQAFAVWASIWTCFLQGVGYIGWDSILASLVGALTLIIQIGVVLLGGGLVALAIVAACGALGQRFAIVGFARTKKPELFSVQGSWRLHMVKGMMPLALRAWLTSLGTTLVLNTDQLFVGRIMSTSDLPPYRAAYLILLNLNVLSVTMASASAVFVSHLWQAGELGEVHRIVVRNLRLGLGFMACSGACVLALGHRLFDLWLGVGNFVGYPVLIVFFVLLFLEAQCFIVTTSSRATEDEAFAPWALSAGLLKLGLSALLGMRYGLVGIAMGTLIAQLVTNHWFMVYRGLRRLRMSLRQHALKVLAPVIVACMVTFSAVGLTEWLTSGMPLWAQVLLGCGVAGCVLIGLFWTLVLEESQRRRLITYSGVRPSRA